VLEDYIIHHHPRIVGDPSSRGFNIAKKMYVARKYIVERVGKGVM
jgi:hypothetical protein